MRGDEIVNHVTVALLQMTSNGNDQEANRVKGDVFCRRAHAIGADIALFPEMWNIGYTPYAPWDELPEVWKAPELWTPEAAAIHVSEEVIARWQMQAIGRDDPFIVHFRGLAKELAVCRREAGRPHLSCCGRAKSRLAAVLRPKQGRQAHYPSGKHVLSDRLLGMAIAITYLEKWDGGPRNTVSLIDRHGEIVMTYAKVHTCIFSMECACTPGDDFYVCTLDTAHGPIKVGAMICYDREFPESARILMLKGAEIILTPNACELEVNRLGQFRARAYENMVGVAMSNYSGPGGGGHSVAYDPIGFDADGNSRDTLIVEAGGSEGVYLASFDLDALRAHRARDTWGNAFRRPSRYSILTSPHVQDPFIRVTATGERYDGQQSR